MNNIYLIGFMGTGKTTVANNLTKFLPFTVLEMDEAIERVECMSIPEIFSKKGEQGFRDAESQLLKIISQQNNQIISCGGGIVLRQENVDIMKSTGSIVRLVASPEVIYERVSRNNKRPLASGKSLDEIKAMMEEREPMYKNAAEFVVDSSEKDSTEVASEIIKQLALAERLN